MFHSPWIFQLYHIITVADCFDPKGENGQSKGFQRIDDTPVYSSKSICWKLQKNALSKNLEFTPQISENIELSRLLLIDKCQFKKTEPENFITIPSTYLQNTKVSIASSSMNKNLKTSSFMNQLSDTIP